MTINLIHAHTQCGVAETALRRTAPHMPLLRTLQSSRATVEV